MDPCLASVRALSGVRSHLAVGVGGELCARSIMNVVRSIVYGVVGPCKTKSSQKPVPVHSTVLNALIEWRQVSRYNKQATGFLQADGTVGGRRSGARRSSANIFARRAARRNSEAIRMAHVPAYVLDSPAECGNRIQSHAGTVAAFDSAIHIGCVHTGDHASQTCSSGSRLVVGVFVRGKWNVTIVEIK